ncbi:hypothetical protein KY284_010900 [Solanum tuberosum]|nr:hypothetical protein KY284_010900 [Solanum tuberosum]
MKQTWTDLGSPDGAPLLLPLARAIVVHFACCWGFAGNFCWNQIKGRNLEFPPTLSVTWWFAACCWLRILAGVCCYRSSLMDGAVEGERATSFRCCCRCSPVVCSAAFTRVAGARGETEKRQERGGCHRTAWWPSSPTKMRQRGG